MVFPTNDLLETPKPIENAKIANEKNYEETNRGEDLESGSKILVKRTEIQKNSAKKLLSLEDWNHEAKSCQNLNKSFEKNDYENLKSCQNLEKTNENLFLDKNFWKKLKKNKKSDSEVKIMPLSYEDNDHLLNPVRFNKHKTSSSVSVSTSEKNQQIGSSEENKKDEIVFNRSAMYYDDLVQKSKEIFKSLNSLK